MSLSSKAMLVRLERKAWTTYKFDKSITGEVEQKHNAHNVVRVNKKLFYKYAPFSRISIMSQGVYAYHQSMTLPWRYDGVNILPCSLALDYYSNMSRLISAFDAEVADFDLDSAIRYDATRLGGLFNRADYPASKQDFLSKFKISYSLYPVPDVEDFRVSIPDEEIRKFQNELKRAEQQVTSTILQQIATSLIPIIDVTSKENTRYHKTLKTNIETLLPKLTAFNLGDDCTIVELTSSLTQFVTNLDIERCKSDESYRGTIRREADAILGRIESASKDEVVSPTQEVGTNLPETTEVNDVEAIYQQIRSKL